jgi:hypothetical protein
MGLAAAGAALIEKDHAVMRRIEKTPMLRADTGPRAAMQEHHRRAPRISRFLEVQLMIGGYLQGTRPEGFDFGV